MIETTELLALGVSLLAILAIWFAMRPGAGQRPSPRPPHFLSEREVPDTEWQRKT